MDSSEALGLGFVFVFLAILAVGLIPLIFYLLTLQKALSKCAPFNRAMSPGLVWLMVIPLAGLIWQFFVVIFVASALRKEFAWRRMPLVGDAGRSLGLVMSSLMLVAGILGWFDAVDAIDYIVLVLELGALVLWILYWVKISRLSRRLDPLPGSYSMQPPGPYYSGTPGPFHPAPPGPAPGPGPYHPAPPVPGPYARPSGSPYGYPPGSSGGGAAGHPPPPVGPYPSAPPLGPYPPPTYPGAYQPPAARAPVDSASPQRLMVPGFGVFMAGAAFSSRGEIKTLSIDEDRRAVLVTTMENGMSSGRVYEASDLAGVELLRDHTVIARVRAAGAQESAIPLAGDDEGAEAEEVHDDGSHALAVRLKPKRGVTETIWFYREVEIGLDRPDYGWASGQAHSCFDKLAALIAPARVCPGCSAGAGPEDAFCSHCGAPLT